MINDVSAVGDAPTEADLKQSRSHVFLDVVDSLTQLLDDGLGSEGVHVEIVCGRGEYEKSNHGHITALFLKQQTQLQAC